MFLNTHPADGFPRSNRSIPGLLDAIELDAVEELVATEEYRFIAAGGDLDTTLSSITSFLFLTFVSCYA